MLKVIIVITLTTLGFAQENINQSTVSEDESITRLDLSKKGLTTLNNYDFSKYNQLEDIDLSDNNITHIKEGTFTKNEKLRSINLSGNQHLEFPQYSTIFISSIKELNISNCGIQTLPQSAFDGLRYLKIIDLSHNPMVKKSFPTTPFNTIESLEKVILPVENKQLLKELCLFFNTIIIEIKNEHETIPAVQCLNYTYDESEEESTSPTAENLFVPLPDSEKPTVKISNEEPEKKQIEEKTNNEDATSTPISLSVKPKLEPREEIDEKVEISPVLPSSASEQTEGNPTLNSTIKLATEISTTTAPKLEPNVSALEQTNKTDTNTENNPTLNSTITLSTEISITTAPKLEPRFSPVLPINGSALEQTNKTDTNTEPNPILNSTIKLTTEISTTVPKLEPRLNITNKPQVEPEMTNATVPPTAVKPVEVNHTNKPVKMNEPQPKPVTTSEVPQMNKSEKIQLQNNNEEPAKVAEVTEASNTGSTILIVLVVLVVVAGLAAFGYKFYKNKTARAESEQVERELKEIVTNKTNRTETLQDVVEKEPLMNNHLNKENGDVKSSPTNDSINNVLNPHTGSVNKRNSGSPYQPTTTTFKPESAGEVK